MGTVVVATRLANMSKDEILLEGEFEVFPKEKVLYHVQLSRTGITYYQIDSEKSKRTVKYIHFGDVTGCRCRKSVDQKYASKAYLTVFTYPLKKKIFSDKWVRSKNHLTFARNSDETFEGNRKVVEKWRRVILHCCRQLPVNKKGVYRQQFALGTIGIPENVTFQFSLFFSVVLLFVKCFSIILLHYCIIFYIAK